jgi:multiple sugar transport system substrate-binding protein
LAIAAAATFLLPLAATPGVQAMHAKQSATLIWFMRVDPNENPWEKAEVAGFEKLHPDIKINLITAPNPNGQFDAKFNALLQAGTPADIWSHLGQAGFADYYHRGLLLNLDPLIKQTGYSFGTTPMNLVNTYRKPDGLFGIPSITLDSFLFYNKDIFDAYNKLHPNAKLAYPPVNWNDKSWNWATMVSDATKLTGLSVQVPGTSGTTKTYGILENLFPFMGYAWDAGSEMFNQPNSYVTGAPTSINLTDSKIVGIFQDMQNFYKEGISPPYSSVKQISNTGADPFQYGNIAMETTGGWDFRNLRTVKFHWAAAAMPWRVKNEDTLFTDPYMVYKKTKYPQQAMEFIQYLTNPQSMAAYVKTVGFTPANPQYLTTWYSQYSQITGQSVADLKTLVSGGRKYGFESPNHLIDSFSQIHNAMVPFMDKIFYGQGSAASILGQEQTAIDAILQQNNG